jgi:hypothetical protein
VHVTARVQDVYTVRGVRTAQAPLPQAEAAGSQSAVPLLDGGGCQKLGTETTVFAEKTGTSSAAATGQGVSQARGCNEWDATFTCTNVWPSGSDALVCTCVCVCVCAGHVHPQ